MNNVIEGNFPNRKQREPEMESIEQPTFAFYDMREHVIYLMDGNCKHVVGFGAEIVAEIHFSEMGFEEWCNTYAPTYDLLDSDIAKMLAELHRYHVWVYDKEFVYRQREELASED